MYSSFKTLVRRDERNVNGFSELAEVARRAAEASYINIHIVQI
jgi:hypothetical protein